MVLKVYGDELSDPTRAVLSFLELNKVPYEFVFINLWEGQQHSPEYLAVNPLGKVPAIDDDGFKLAESHAILMYLKESRNLDDHWYPRDIRSRAMVDRYLHWHHSNLRVGEALIFSQVIAPAIGLTIDPAHTQAEENTFLKSLFTIDAWLATQPYIAGQEISIADLSAVCEIAEHKLRNLDMSRWPHIQAWMSLLLSLPEIQTVHKRLNESAASARKD